jgi:hypothetical protein
MRVLVMIKATPQSEAGQMPDEPFLHEMARFNGQLDRAGILLAGEGLQPSSHGVRVRCGGREHPALRGPFAPTRELLAGFWLWEVRTMDEALEWARRCPCPPGEQAEIEIRPLYEAEELAGHTAPSPRLRIA